MEQEHISTFGVFGVEWMMCLVFGMVYLASRMVYLYFIFNHHLEKSFANAVEGFGEKYELSCGGANQRAPWPAPPSAARRR